MNSSGKSFFAKILEREIYRYKQKGLKNSLIAFGLLYAVIIYGTKFGEYIWP